MSKQLMICIGLSLISCLTATAQKQDEDSIFYYEAYQVDSLPQLFLNEKQIEVVDFIYQNIRWKEGMSEGERIIVSYLVDTNGYVLAVDIVSMPNMCELCTREFIRVITSMPRFTPAYKDGHPVTVKEKLLFYFEIKR